MHGYVLEVRTKKRNFFVSYSGLFLFYSLFVSFLFLSFFLFFLRENMAIVSRKLSRGRFVRSVIS